MTEENDTNKIISPHRSPLRRFFRWLKIFIIIYCGAGILLYNFQDKFLLHPVAVQPGFHYKISEPFEEINIPINKDENLNVIRFTTHSKPKGAVLYFHGNMMNVSHYAGHALNFTRKGYEVWMPDYPGYGKTTGVISEKKLYDEALLVYKLANTKFPKDSIIIFGKSLGSGIGAQLASIKDCRRLILETPYYSIPSVFGYYVPFYPVSYMSHFKIPTATYLQQVTAPVTIFHGSKDEVIPYSNSLRLRRVLKQGDEFISIPGGKHNDLSTFTIYQQKLDSLLRD